LHPKGRTPGFFSLLPHLDYWDNKNIGSVSPLHRLSATEFCSNIHRFPEQTHIPVAFVPMSYFVDNNRLVAVPPIVHWFACIGLQQKTLSLLFYGTTSRE
jgi:hypothetical protein